MNNTPQVSVVIATYNREAELIKTIQDLLAGDYPANRWELLVVDQTLSHTPEVQMFLEEQERAKKIRWFKPPEIEFASLTKARNFGIAKAYEPEVILFVDDDVEVKADFIEQHVRAYEDSGVGATVGRVVVPGGPQTAKKGAPVGKISWFGAFVNNYESEEPGDSGNLIGCNFSLRASILSKAGKFDEAFMGNALREDSDMAVRVLKAGFRIRFVPEALVIHKQAISGGTRSQTDRIKWYYALFYNNFLFYANNYSAWRLPFFIVHMWRPILACAFWYGQGRPQALVTPWRGIIAGIKAAREKLDR